MRETYKKMVFEAALPNGHVETFTFSDYVEWLEWCDFLIDDKALEEAIRWLQADNYSRVNSWLSITMMKREESTIH